MAFGLFSAFVLVPQFVQSPRPVGLGFGKSVTAGALSVLPMSAAMLLVSPLVGRAVNRWGPRPPIIAGAVSMTAALAFLTVAHERPWEIYVSMGLLGAGIGSSYSSVANQIIDWVPSSHTGVATGMASIIRFIGNSFGAQVSAAVVASTVVAGALPTEHGFTLAFGLSTCVAAVAVVIAVASPGRGPRHAPAAAAVALGAER
jgi:MFS family permease